MSHFFAPHAHAAVRVRSRRLAVVLLILLVGLAGTPAVHAQASSNREALLARLRAKAEARRLAAEAAAEAAGPDVAPDVAPDLGPTTAPSAGPRLPSRPPLTQLASAAAAGGEFLPPGPLPASVEGFEHVERDTPVRLTYAVARPRVAEYVQELQALIQIPGVQGLVPHHRLYQLRAEYVGKDDDGDLRWSYKVLQARRSRPQEGKVVLVSDEDAVGTLIPITFSPTGVEDSALPGQNRILDWLRIPLPENPVKVGQPWTAKLPVELGNRVETTRALYVIERLVSTGGHLVAVIGGRFALEGHAGGSSRFGSMGQERLLFDVDDGVVLFREFRFEGTQARKGKERIIQARTRVKGVVFETGLFREIEVKTGERFKQVARLLDAS